MNKNPAWAHFDFGFDEYTLRKEPPSPHWVALDSFYFINFSLITLLIVIVDAKMVMSGIWSRVAIHRRFMDNTLPSNETEDEAWMRDLEERANDILDAVANS